MRYEGAHRLPPGREHEIRIDVRRSLRKLATRIDEGYSIEVHAYTPPEPEEAVEGEAEEIGADEVGDVAHQIAAGSPRCDA